MIWDELTSAGLAKLDRNIPVILTLTATEQHGAHLPLATDRLIGEHFVHALNAVSNDTVLILPAVSIGCSDHHMDFPGTLSLSHATFLSVVKETVRSVLAHGFHKIILFNSHGGNQGIMNVAFEQLGYENPGAHIVAATWWTLAKGCLKEISDTGPGGTGHACEFETSLMMVIGDNLIDKSAIQDRANVPAFKWAEGDMLQGGTASYYRRIKSMAPNGVYGEPRAASVEKGRQITTCVVNSLKQVVTDLYNIKISEKK